MILACSRTCGRAGKFNSATRSPFRPWAAALLIPLMLLAMTTFVSGQSEDSAALGRLRTALLSVHGFSRDQLNAVHADAPAVLQMLIDAPAESNLVRRQAIKALSLYPSEETLRFVSQRLDTAPLGLKRLYIAGLASFGDVSQVTVSVLLDRALQDADPTVRHAAVVTGRALIDKPAVRSTLEGRSASEPDAAIRQDLLKALNRR